MGKVYDNRKSWVFKLKSVYKKACMSPHAGRLFNKGELMRKVCKTLKGKDLIWYRDTEWTQSAIDCYKRHCRCQGCSVFEAIGYKCRMKHAVIDLVKKEGVPRELLSDEDNFI